MLRPVQIVGGEQTLYAVTHDGKVYATGYNAGGRLGIGGIGKNLEFDSSRISII